MGHEVTTKPEEWSKDLDYSADMHDYIHNKLTVFENSIKSGFKDGKWYPHESLEGGRKTIAYGHKLKGDESFDKGLTEEDAKSLLVKDTLEAYRRAFNSYKNKYGLKEWNKLSNKAKIALTDLSFNIGNTKDYEEALEELDTASIQGNFDTDEVVVNLEKWYGGSDSDSDEDSDSDSDGGYAVCVYTFTFYDRKINNCMNACI